MDIITAKIAAILAKKSIVGMDIEAKLEQAKQVLGDIPEDYNDLEDSVNDIRDRIVNVVTVRNEDDANEQIELPLMTEFSDLETRVNTLEKAYEQDIAAANLLRSAAQEFIQNASELIGGEDNG